MDLNKVPSLFYNISDFHNNKKRQQNVPSVNICFSIAKNPKNLTKRLIAHSSFEKPLAQLLGDMSTISIRIQYDVKRKQHVIRYSGFSQSTADTTGTCNNSTY